MTNFDSSFFFYYKKFWTICYKMITLLFLCKFAAMDSTGIWGDALMVVAGLVGQLRGALPWMAGASAVAALAAQLLVEWGGAPSAFGVLVAFAAALAQGALLAAASAKAGEAVRGAEGLHGRRRCLGIPLRALPAIALLFAVTGLAAWGAHGLLGLVPGALGHLLCLAVDGLLGFAFLAVAFALCAWAQRPSALGPGGAIAGRGGSVVGSSRKMARAALSCLMSFLLAFSLLGSSFPAWADEASAVPSAQEPPLAQGLGEEGDASEGADGDGEAEDAVDGNAAADEVRDDGFLAGGEALGDEASAEGSEAGPAAPDSAGAESDAVADDPSTQPARMPVDYYEQPETEGHLVSYDGAAAVYSLGDGQYRTVLGGVDTAYMDEDGDARAIDNTLVAAEAPEPVGNASGPLVAEARTLSLTVPDAEGPAGDEASQNPGSETSAAAPDADSPLARAAGAVPEAWEPRSNGVRVRIPSDLGPQSGVTYEGEGWRASLAPLEGDFSRPVAQGEAVRFSDVLPGVDWQYTMLGSLVKEDVVLQRPVEPFQLREALCLSEDLTAVAEGTGIAVYRTADLRTAAKAEIEPLPYDNGAEALVPDAASEDSALATDGTGAEAFASDGVGDGSSAVDGEDGTERPRPVLVLSAPLATDAAGEFDNHLQLALEEAGEGRYLVEVLPDWEWLSAPERAYPVRIDPAVDIAPSAMRVTVAEQYAPNVHISEDGYAFAGFDDGVKTGSGAFRDGEGLGIGRVYIAIQYNFKNIMDEARIDSATLDLHQRWYYSGGKTEFGLYRNLAKWDFDTLTWNTQKNMGHEFICSRNALKKSGYIQFDVRTPVANWIAGAWPQNGLCVKALDERNMQCEIFDQRTTSYPPKLSIDWTIPDPVPDSTSINATTATLRPVAEADISGKLRFDGAFADGVAQPRSIVAYELLRGSTVADGGGAYASRSYQYPNSSSWEGSLPNGTKYRDKLSNWQSKLFTGLTEDTVYQIRAHAESGTAVGKHATTDKFLVYRATAKDTLPSIAAHYGTTTDQLARDNGVQDMLVVGGNTLFVRNPKTTARYAPKALSDAQKRRIDSALMGRNMHCEYGFEPVNLNTGNFTIETVDATLAGIEEDLELARSYNAMAEQSPSVFGPGWASPFDEHIGLEESGAVALSCGDGKTYWFDPAGGNRFSCALLPGAVMERIPYKSGSRTLYKWEARYRDGSSAQFNCNGLLVSRTSATGLVTAFSRDSLGRLTAIKTPEGQTLAVTCNSEGLITAIRLPDGTKLAYGYTAGRLTSFTDQAGNSCRYVYDGAGRMIARYDRAGRRVVQNNYDSAGRVVRQWDAEGNASALQYGNGWTKATDACGNVTTYRYDSYGRTTAVEYPDGTVAKRSYDKAGNLASDENGTYGYDSAGRMVRQTTVGGRTTRWAYDGKGRLVSRTDADGSLWRWERNSAGHVTAEVSPATGRTAYTVDSYGRQTSATDADGVRETYTWSGALLRSRTTAAGTTTWAYDAMGRPVSETAPDGSVTRRAYSPTGELVSETDACGATTAYALDPEGLVLFATDALGQRSSFAYDRCCRMTAATDAAGNTSRWAYDGCGNVVAETDAAGATVRYGRDSRGRVAWEEDALGNRTSYEYDAKGRAVAVTDPLGNRSTAQWDADFDVAVAETDPMGNVTLREAGALGQVLREVSADGSEEAAEWGPGGTLLASTDGAGARTAYTWTAAGRLAKVDREGAVWAFWWDAAGNLAESVAPNGNRTAYQWSAAGQLTAADDDAGPVGRWGFDRCGRQVWEEDGLGQRSGYEYDRLGNLVAATDAAGNRTVYQWDAAGNLIAVTAPNGARTAVAYDAAGRPVQITDALGNSRSAAYDAAGRMVAVTDALGNETRYSYDAAGNQVEAAHPDGTTEAWGYDPCGNAVSATDALGRTTMLEYDAMGRLAAASDEEGPLLTAAYDGEGRVLASTDALGRQWLCRYDEWGNLCEVEAPGGAVQQWQWDAMGNLVRYTDQRGGAWAYAYDARGQMISQLREVDGALELFAYDGAGNLAAFTDPLGNQERYEWDPLGNLATVVDAQGARTAYQWDAAGNLLGKTDPLGNQTTYGYDLLGQLVQAVSAEGAQETWEWGAQGLPVAHTNPLGNRETWEWDALGRLAAATDLSGARTSYSYDAAGNVTAETDAAGNSATYSYGYRDQLTSRTDRTGATWEYLSDAAGRTVQVTSPRGLVTQLAWDDADNLVSATDNLGRGGSWAYDAAGNLTSATDALGNSEQWEWDAAGNLTAYVSALGARETYRWDAAGNLLEAAGAAGERTTYTWSATGELLAQAGPEGARIWEYDAAGNPVASTDALGNRTAWEWDKDGRPVAETSPTGAVTAFTWDAAGNLAAVTDALGNVSRAEYDPMGRITKALGPTGAETLYGYDALGNLTSVTDAQGAETSYGYDAEGRLSQVTDALGRTTRYGRDAEGGLTSVEGPDGTAEQLQLDPAGRVSAMVDGAGNVTAYRWDELDRLVEKSYPGTEYAPVTYSYEGAGQGFSVRSDSVGEAGREYDQLGRLVAETDAAGRRIGYERDEAGRLAVLEYPDGTKVRYSYNEAGQLARADAADGAYLYEYDEEGRPVRLTRPDGTVTRWAYDALGQVTEAVTEGAGGQPLAAFAYSYDADGNPVAERSSVVQPDGTSRLRSRAYAYDETGKLTSFEERDVNEKLLVREAYSWDAAGNRTAIARTAGENPGQILFAYDEANRLVAKSGADGAASYSYDRAGRLVSAQEEGGQERTFSYGAEGRLAAVREGGRVLFAAVWDGDGNKVGQASLYHTDEVEVVLTEGAPAGTAEAATAGQRPAPDAHEVPISIVGQRFISASAAAPMGAGLSSAIAATANIASRSDAAPVSETAGPNRAPWPLALLLAPNPAAMVRALTALLPPGGDENNTHLPKDNKGNPAASSPGALAALLPQAGLTPVEVAQVAGQVTLASDVAATRKALEGGAAANAPPQAGAPVPVENPYVQERWELAEYATASALGDTSKALWRSSSATGASQNLLYGEGQALLSSLPSNALPQIAPGAANADGASAAASPYGLAEDALTETALTGTGASYYLDDGRGSVAALLAGGEVASAYAYSPWGEASGAGELPFFGYNSQEHVGGGTALQYLRARFYDAAQAAFPTADTYLGDASDPATLNRYAYCAGNPVTYSDPTGHERFSSQKQRNSWLKNNSAKGKTQKLNTKLALKHRKSPLSTGMNNLALSMSKLPLWSGVAARAARVSSGTPKASQAFRTEMPGLVTHVSLTPKSGSQKKVSSSSSSKSLWGGARSGSLFPHVVSYSQSQAQKIRGNYCSKDMKHIGAQTPEPVKIALNVTHTVLDLLGIPPAIGSGPDLINALIYFAERNDFEGVLSLGATIPFAGDSAQIGRLGAKYGDDVVDAVGGLIKNSNHTADEVAKGADEAFDSILTADRVGDLDDGFLPGEVADSGVLRTALKKAGIQPPKYANAAHHIVAGADARAAESRKLLEKYHIGINSASNGVFLPYKDAGLLASYHPSVHTDYYYRDVQERLMKAEKRGKNFNDKKDSIIAELRRIRYDLESGKYKGGEQ